MLQTIETIETIASNSKIADSVNKSCLLSNKDDCIRPAKRFSQDLKYDSFIPYEKQITEKNEMANKF